MDNGKKEINSFGYDEFSNCYYDDEEEYYRSTKQTINYKETDKYYEKNFLEIFKKYIDNESTI